MLFSQCSFVRDRSAILMVLVIILSANAVAQDPPATSGPMVGHTTDSSAIIWMYAPKN